MQERFARLFFALSIAAAIGMQIPGHYDNSFAKDCYANICFCNASYCRHSKNGGKFLGTSLSNREAFTDLAIVGAAASAIHANRRGGSAHGAKTVYDIVGGAARGLIDLFPELVETLQSDGPFTLFLPSDETLSRVRLDPSKLEDLLKRHVVLGRYSYKDLRNLSDGATLRTLAGTTLLVTHASDGKVEIGGILVPQKAGSARNGFQYIIEGFLP